jgi:hypothetical protein
VITSVVPRELEAELYDQLVRRYSNHSDVTVIVDRRYGGPNDRRRGPSPTRHDERRVTRDRRRARATGTFPHIVDG